MHGFARSAGRTLGTALLTFALGATLFGIGAGSAARHRAARPVHLPSWSTLGRERPVGTRFQREGVSPRAREVVALRTATSRTFLNPRGTFVRLISAQPINYRDGAGHWQPIDNRLVRSSRSGYAYSNAANRYRLQLPNNLSRAPVEIGVPGGSLAFSLLGADAPVRASGASARYQDALPQTNVSYLATSEGVKESLTLASAAAPHAFRYRLRLSSGLRLHQAPGGSIQILNGQHRPLGSLTAPFMYDRAGARSSAVHVRTVRSGSGYLLTMTPSRRWLTSKRRLWPVTVDPSYTNTGGIYDCYIVSGSPDTNYCGGTTLKLGYDGTNKYRSLVQYDFSGMPQSSVIVDAQLSLYTQSKTTSNTSAIGLYRLTRPWSTLATWNKSDDDINTTPTHPIPWTTPGGDFVSTAAANNPSVGGTTGAFTFSITQLVQDWVDSAADNDGLLVKQTGETVNNVLTLGSSDPSVPYQQTPLLSVTYTFGQGDWGRYTQVAQQGVDDQLGFSVNASTGDLLVNAQNGPLSLHYNSLGAELLTGASGELGGYGEWTMGTGLDQSLQFFADGTVGYHDGSGYMVGFPKNSDGSYQTPPSMDAILTQSGSTYTLTSIGDASVETFNGNGLLTSEKDLNGNTTTFNYQSCSVCPFSSWQLASIVDSSGLTTSFAYDATTGNLTSMTEPGNRTYSYAYDTNGYLKSITDPAGKITSFTTSLGELTKITDPNGNVINISYDIDGTHRVASFTRVTADATNPTTSFTYNDYLSGASKPYSTVMTDPDNHATTFYYDDLSRVTKVTDAKGNSTQVSFTDGVGSLGYNASDPRNCGTNDNVCAVKDANGNISNFGYFSDHNQLNEKWAQSPLQGTTNRPSFLYTSGNHPYWATQSTNAQGSKWDYTYDNGTGNANGNLTSQGDEAGSGATAQAPVSFTYNFDASSHPQGTIHTAVDAKGNTTTYSYTYDANNPKLLTQMVVNPPSPLPATTINYDSLGRVSSEVDGNANTRAYTYDALDRTKTITYSHSGQSSSTITYNYDADGNVTSMVDDSGTTGDTYDALNRLTKETRPGGGTTQYAYDKASNLTALTDGGGTTNYLYDSTNLLSKITEPNGNQTTFGYDANGNRTSITYPGSVVGTFGYDASNRIHTINWVQGGTTTLASDTYSYADPSTGKDTDLRQSVVSFLSGDSQSTTTTYGYDYFARLTSASSTGGSTSSYSYAYDVNGNRTSQTVNGTSTYYLHNAANELCWSGSTNPGTTYTCSNLPSGGKTYSYDSNGNMLTGSSNSFAYNSKNQTSSITPNGGSAINMTYTGPGQARRTAAGSTGYVNDALGVASEGSTYYTRDSSGTVLGERSPSGGSGSYYFLFDGLGSVIAVCDSTGAIRDTFKYDAYGGTTSSTAPIANPWRFAGGYLDGQTNLYKYGERYYDQALGTWTQLDPVNDPLDTHGWNRYVYAGDDPIDLVDPSGQSSLFHRFVKISLGAGTIITGTVIGGFIVARGVIEVAGGAAEIPETGGLSLLIVGHGFLTIGVGATFAGAAWIGGGKLILQGLKIHHRHAHHRKCLC